MTTTRTSSHTLTLTHTPTLTHTHCSLITMAAFCPHAAKHRSGFAMNKNRLVSVNFEQRKHHHQGYLPLAHHLTPSLTPSLTHTHTLSHSLTHTLTHSLTHTHSLSLTLSHKLAHEACALCVHTTETELNKRKEQASNAISWARGCQGVSWMSCGCGTVMLQSVLKSTEWKHLYPHIRSSTMHCE